MALSPVTALKDRAETEDLVVRYAWRSTHSTRKPTSIEILDEDEARHTSYAQTVRLGDDARFVIGFMGRYEDVIVKARRPVADPVAQTGVVPGMIDNRRRFEAAWGEKTCRSCRNGPERS